MTRQEESLKKRIIEQMSKMAKMLEAGATVILHEKLEGENRYGLNVKLSYDDKIKTRAKILFSGGMGN